jgi:hypothetical protein
MTPTHDRTMSKRPVSNGRSSASASTQSRVGAAGRGELLSDLQQAGRQVARGHVRPGERGGDGGVSGAGRDVEDLLPGRDSAGLDE